MDDSLKSLSQIFDEKIYRIPVYQRGYRLSVHAGPVYIRRISLLHCSYEVTCRYPGEVEGDEGITKPPLEVFFVFISGRFQYLSSAE